MVSANRRNAKLMIGTKMGEKLRIAVQKKGRLTAPSLQILELAGYELEDGRNELVRAVSGEPIEIMLVRDDDIPAFVSSGACQFGIMGENELREAQLSDGTRQLEIHQPLGFGHCALKLAIGETENWRDIKQLDGQRIATSYPNLLRDFLEQNQVNADLIKLEGAVEVAPRLGLAEAVCDLVSTGRTLKQNNLKPVMTVFESQAVCVRSTKTVVPELKKIAHSVSLRIVGVALGRAARYIMMNAPEDAVEAITALLPGSTSPTVMPLQKSGMVAIHAVSPETVFWETLEALKMQGAESILVLPIEKMMP